MNDNRNGEIGLRMKKVRLRKCLTQAQVAEQLQVTPNYYSTLERGANAPKKSLVHLFGSVFGASTEWLMTGVGSPERAM